jgi:uncharacterized protein YcfL
MKTILISLALAGVVVGCKSPPPEGAYVAVAKPGSPEAAGVKVVLLNYKLTQTLAVDRPPIATRDSNNRLSVQVPLRNRTNDQKLQLQVQTLYFNPAGMVLYSQLGSESAWQTITLSPNQTSYYTSTALTSEAENFTVRVRYMRNPD